MPSATSGENGATMADAGSVEFRFNV